MKADIEARIKEGRLIFVGEKLPEDFYHGFNIWSEESAKGNPIGDYNIAYCYSTGNGTKKDETKAIYYYEKALAAGLTEAGLRMLRLKRNMLVGYQVSFQLFDANPSSGNQENINRFNMHVPDLLIFADKLKSLGCEILDKDIFEMKQLSQLLKLHNDYKTGGVDAFVKTLSSLPDQSLSWVKELACIPECRIIEELTNTRTNDITAGGVVNGTTQYHSSKPYYKYSGYYSIENQGNTPIHISGMAGRTELKPEESRLVSSYSGKSAEKFKSEGKLTKVVTFRPFRDNIPLSTSGAGEIEIGFNIPVKTIEIEKDEVHSNKSPIGIAIGVILIIVSIVSFLVVH